MKGRKKKKIANRVYVNDYYNNNQGKVKRKQVIKYHTKSMVKTVERKKEKMNEIKRKMDTKDQLLDRFELEYLNNDNIMNLDEDNNDDDTEYDVNDERKDCKTIK